MAEKQPSRVFRFSQKKLAEMFATGEAKIVSKQEPMLMHEEQEAWERFLGREITIPDPPKELFKVLKRAEEAGIRTFKPHYLPTELCAKFIANNGNGIIISADPKPFPGWRAPLSEWFWTSIIEDMLGPEVAQLNGGWILYDTTLRPDKLTDDYEQMYPDDPLKDFLTKLRREGKLDQPDDILEGSRFAISWDCVHKTVFPELAKILGVDPDTIRLPRAIEYNILGNIFHYNWSLFGTSELYQDRYRDKNENLVGGDFSLTYVSWNTSNAPDPSKGFRPLIVWQDKGGSID